MRGEGKKGQREEGMCRRKQLLGQQARQSIQSVFQLLLLRPRLRHWHHYLWSVGHGQ